MTKLEYAELAETFAREARVEAGLHSYFKQHRSRLWATGEHFNLWNQRDKQVLEIGPFFSYTPLFLSSLGNQVTVIEGPEPAVEPLHVLYEKRGIPIHYFDFFQTFGTGDPATRRLPFPGDTFDIVNCWETMEHFNFNPVEFVRELRRVLKPAGVAYVTVPNNARLELRIALLRGKSIHPEISSYFQFAEYNNGRFYGWHWREYVLSELYQLFSESGFQITSSSHLTSYFDYQRISPAKKALRTLLNIVFKAAPSTGKTCAITARKVS